MSKAGERVPDVALHYLDDGKLQTVRTAQLFGTREQNRAVIVFALPGAFTPTCSSQHLPQYEELMPSFREQGIEAVLCLSVNDPYVMAEWSANQQAREVRLLSDGNGEFASAMNMLVDLRAAGLGQRSRRYSMLVRGGVIERLFVEADRPGEDPFEVSDAGTLLDYLAPRSARPPRIALLSKPGCPFCARARQMLDEQGLRYTDIPLVDAVRSRVLAAIADASTTPQVYADGRRIGGSDELAAWLKSIGR